MDDTKVDVNGSEDAGAAPSGEINGPATLDSVGLESQIVQGFDPDRHMTGANGEPLRTVTGELRRKPGRKPGQKSGAAPVQPGQTPDTAKRVKTKLEAKSDQISAEALAGLLCALTTRTLSRVIGPEWEFADEGESAAVQGALAAYIHSKGDKHTISPEMLLALVLASYGAQRIAHENTRSKFGKAWDFVKSGFKAIFRPGR